MATPNEFNPTELLEEPSRLTEVTTATDAAVLKQQSTLHRQRVGAARRAVRRAEQAQDADALERATDRLAVRTARRFEVDEQFAVANIREPEPTKETGQVVAVAAGAEPDTQLVAALLDASNKVVREATMSDAGGATFSFEGNPGELRLQISDADGNVRFRDGEAFRVELGEVVTRVGQLGDPIKDPKPAPTSLIMPDLTGLTADVACAILFRLGVRDIDIKEQVAPPPFDVVIDQTPEAEAVLNPSDGASIVVSISGEEPPEPPTEIVMPDFVGTQIEVVTRAAKRLGLRLKTTEREDQAEKGLVIEQTPDVGTTLSAPFDASVVVSLGGVVEIRRIRIPDVIGKNIDDAKAIAEELNIGLEVGQQASTLPKDEIIEQAPPGDTLVALPATLKVIVSSGGETTGGNTVVVPNVVGTQVARVKVLAERLGLELSTENEQSSLEVGLVLRQEPPAGSEVDVGSKLAVRVSSGRGGPSPVNPNFRRDVVRLAALDDRFAGLEVSRQKLTARLRSSQIDSAETLSEILALDNEALAQWGGFQDRNRARTLRSILKRALEQLG